MMHYSSSRRQQGRRTSLGESTHINIAPLVDVMLVLLVIFMVTAPMLTVGVPVDLPKTTAAKMNDNIEPIIVSVDSKGDTFIQDSAVDFNNLAAKLKNMTVNEQNPRIYVRGDKELSYGKVMEVMGNLAAAGFEKVSLLAEMPTAITPKKTR